ncbi:unnamed protein product [Linum tenue]|uniref:Uncharacterized protein n=1 Tax=Linum tenue TaxID=586396 RepID=A0AAV0MG45_9ROSI|nr:unnamed protein product [Linum tenue]
MTEGIVNLRSSSSGISAGQKVYESVFGHLSTFLCLALVLVIHHVGESYCC